jgi:3-hydroxyisobutyrate dehydrogenase
VELAIDEAKALDVPVPVLNEARSLWHGAIEQGRGRDDFTSILKIVEARGGVTVRGVPRR